MPEFGLRRGLVLSLVALIAAGCSVPHDEAWVEQLRSREAGDLEARMVSDGDFAVEVPASLYGSIEPGQDADYVAFSIGSDTPIECALYHDEVESASSLQTFAAHVFSLLEERYGAPAERTITELDAGVVGASPFLKLYWRYRVDRGEGEVLGELKQMIASREGRSIYCVHHENGYRETFARVFGDLLGSLRFSAYDQLRPYFTQVDVLSAGGENFGFSVVTATLEEDGDPRIVRYTASLGRSSDGGVTARDVTEVEHSTVNGVLRNKIYTDFRNGEVATALVLEDVGEAAWQVRGERAGAPLQADFTEERLESWLGRSRALRYITLDPIETGRTFDAKVWAPAIDAGGSVARRAKLENVLEGDRFAASLSVGEQRSTAVVGRDGLTFREVHAAGGGEVVQERVYTEGALR